MSLKSELDNDVKAHIDGAKSVGSWPVLTADRQQLYTARGCDEGPVVAGERVRGSGGSFISTSNHQHTPAKKSF